MGEERFFFLKKIWKPQCTVKVNIAVTAWLTSSLWYGQGGDLACTEHFSRSIQCFWPLETTEHVLASLRQPRLEIAEHKQVVSVYIWGAPFECLSMR